MSTPSSGITAEVIRDYVKKGSQLFIEGKLQTRSWDDKESGQKKYKSEVLVGDLTLMGGPDSRIKEKNSAAVPTNSSSKRPRHGRSIQSDEYAHTYITDEDIPF